jgi:7-cyano-7-deazaguanine synthase in queuosine biosynthesis
MSAVEVLAADDSPVRADDALALRWPTSQTPSEDVVTDMEWSLSVFGQPSMTARDLVRVAAAAYLADRCVRRSEVYFSRRLEIVVHLDDPGMFLSPTGKRLVDLLAWLTGDAWTLTPVQNRSAAGETLVATEDRSEVMLLSGGLDSLCGAVAALETQGRRLHLGHRDQTRAIARSQDLLARSMKDVAHDFAWQRIRLAPAKSSDNSTRTRSLLFMSLAVAAASAASATRVAVPENGFTSLNVPLLPSRGGALSTKSTHPWTFRQMNALLEDLGIDVRLENPHAMQTKGEMLNVAHEAGVSGFLDMAGHTLSCSKLDGGLGYEGGNPNLNCGLCIACLVRRGAFLGAGVSDRTEYLLDQVTASGRDKLVRARHWDIWAVQTWRTRRPQIDDLMVSGSWPPGTDYDAMLDVVVRGRNELLEALDAAL